MTSSRDPDRLIHDFLLEGEELLPDQVYDAVRGVIEQKRQRAGIGLWRTPTMNKFVTIGLGAAAAVVLLLVGAQLLGPPTGGLGDQPSPSPTLEPTPEPTPSPSADTFLPEGPILLWDPSTEESLLGAPTITVTIQAPEWQFQDEYQFLHKGPGEDDAHPDAGAVVWPGSYPPETGIYVYGDPCQWASSRPETPATTADEVVAALASQASRNASEPTDVMIDGYAGKTITLHVPDDAAFTDCDQGTFGSYAVEGYGEGSPTVTLHSPGQINQFWILDVEGSIVIIDAWHMPDTPDELVAEVQAIVESATFGVP